MAEQLRDIKERYVSLEVSVSRILERLQMEDAERENRKLKRSSSFYGVFGLSRVASPGSVLEQTGMFGSRSPS